jgi:hypothetical protein
MKAIGLMILAVVCTSCVTGCDDEQQLVKATAAVEAMNLRLDSLESSGALDAETIAAARGLATAVDVASQKAAEGPAEALGTASEVAGALLPPPWGTILSGILGVAAVAATRRARKNRLAGRAIAAAVDTAAELNDGVVNLKDPKTRMILGTMGPTATKIVREGLGKEAGLGL